MLTSKSFALILVVLIFAGGSRAAHAQAAWMLSLTNPNASVVAGTSGSVVCSGIIQNTDPFQTLNLFGDALTTGNWDSSLTVSEDPVWLAFLGGGGSLGPGASYNGPLFDVAYLDTTPAASAPPYDGMIRIDTDGSPPSDSAGFTLSVSGQVVPEGNSLALIAAPLLVWLLVMRRRTAPRHRLANQEGECGVKDDHGAERALAAGGASEVGNHRA